MNDLSKNIIENYQVRKTKKQKTEFIELIQNKLKEHKITIENGGPLKSRNIVIGDLNKCKYILTAHYDTAPVIPIPNFLTPKNFIVYLLYCLLVVLGLIAVEAVIMFLVMLFTKNAMVLNIVNTIVEAFVYVWLFAGKANKNTMNDNTSGVITLLEALADPDLKEHICCVLFDHEETGLWGSMYFARKHKKELKDKLLFNFDCVGDGDTIMLILNKGAHKERDHIKAAFISNEEKQFLITKAATTIYPSDQVNFKKAIGVAAFRKNRLFGYYVDKIHTKKDTVLDEENVRRILNGLKCYTN